LRKFFHKLFYKKVDPFMVSAPTPPSPDTPHAKLQHSLATAYWMHRIHSHKDVHAVLQPKKAGKKTHAVHLEHLQTATAKATLLKLKRKLRLWLFALMPQAF
jgi:hypothetical protein